MIHFSKIFTRNCERLAYRYYAIITPRIYPTTVAAAKAAARYDIDFNRRNHEPIVPILK